MVSRPLRSRCYATVKLRVPGRPRSAGWRRNAKVESRMQGRSRRTGWFRNALVESRMQSISRGAFFLSHQRHARHRKLRVIRRERHGVGAYRDQRCRQCSTSERETGHSKRHSPDPDSFAARIALLIGLGKGNSPLLRAKGDRGPPADVLTLKRARFACPPQKRSKSRFIRGMRPRRVPDAPSVG